MQASRFGYSSEKGRPFNRSSIDASVPTNVTFLVSRHACPGTVELNDKEGDLLTINAAEVNAVLPNRVYLVRATLAWNLTCRLALSVPGQVVCIPYQHALVAVIATQDDRRDPTSP